MISTLPKERKSYCDNYFKDKINNMKNTWKGIKSVISFQYSTNESPKLISLGDQTVTDLRTATNTFNSFSCSVASEVQSEVSFSYQTILNIFPPPKIRFSFQLVETKI